MSFRYWDGTEWVDVYSLGGNPSVVAGTIVADIEADTGSVSDGATTNSNENVMSTSFPEIGTPRWRATLPHFHRNHEEGDVTFRIILSSAWSGQALEVVKWQLSIIGLKTGTSLVTPGYQVADTQLVDMSGYLFDTIVHVDLNIPAAMVDPAAEVYCFELSRLADDAQDTSTRTMHVHGAFLMWTGRGLV